MKDFSFSVPQNIIVGRGSIARLPEVLKELGATHAFIISGPHLAKIGMVQSCIDKLAAVGIGADSFTETEKNPSVETVDKATARFKESGADCIVALGGGSPMDVGVTEEHLDAMADDAMKSGNIAVNPRASAKRDILDLYRRAL